MSGKAELAMHIITMPQAGQTMEEGTIVRWLVNEGSQVTTGQPILEIETDKATIEVESTQSGILHKILVPEGRTVLVHTPLALIGQPDEDVTGESRQTETPPLQEEPEFTRAPALRPAEGVVPILMPTPGQSVEEATIIQWRVQPGDRIEKGQIIFEVETDKATIEIEAPDAGRLARIVVPEGQLVPVRTPVAYLAEHDTDVDAFLAKQGYPPATTQQAQPTTPSVSTVPRQTPPPVTVTTESGRVAASPRARKVAKTHGVDLEHLGAGSGPHGRIVTADVLAAAKTHSGTARPSGEVVRRRMTGMRRAIARNLVQSKAPVPHFYMRLTIDVEPLLAFCKAEKAKYPCSVNDAVILACARTMEEFPAFRCRVEGEELVEHPSANIGIAVGMDDGLVVPVLTGAERYDLRGIAAESRRLVELARGGKVEGMGQGTFTISNLGMFGVEEFSAIINPPEAAILAVGAAREDVLVRDGAIRPGRTMTLTLSCDHRVVDGLLAAKFLAQLREYLELRLPLS